MTVRELIKGLIDNCEMDDKVELEVKTQDEYKYSSGNAYEIIPDKGIVCISSVN